MCVLMRSRTKITKITILYERKKNCWVNHFEEIQPATDRNRVIFWKGLIRRTADCCPRRKCQFFLVSHLGKSRNNTGMCTISWFQFHTYTEVLFVSTFQKDFLLVQSGLVDQGSN